MEKILPQEQHQWLHKLVGEWTYEADSPCSPGHEPQKSTGSETVRALGKLWVVCEGEGEMPDGEPAKTVMTLGFDPGKDRFVGTWIGSMMNWLWVYEGTLDPAKTVLTLESEGPSFEHKGRLAKYRDVIEWKSSDHRVMSSHLLGDDGTWRAIMKADYRRRA